LDLQVQSDLQVRRVNKALPDRRVLLVRKVCQGQPAWQVQQVQLDLRVRKVYQVQ
jgi:hypothetical protein